MKEKMSKVDDPLCQSLDGFPKFSNDDDDDAECLIRSKWYSDPALSGQKILDYPGKARRLFAD